MIRSPTEIWTRSLTHPRSWYPLPEGSIQFQKMPKMKPFPAGELSLDGSQKLAEFANIYGRAVRQKSVRQETNMAKEGTLPSSGYEINLSVQRVMLRRDGIHNDSDAPLQPVESHSEDSSGQNKDEDENIEFDSDQSAENDAVEDDTRTNSYDEPQLAPDALFLIGCQSRFGRAIRFNGRFEQYLTVSNASNPLEQ